MTTAKCYYSGTFPLLSEASYYWPYNKAILNSKKVGFALRDPGLA